MLKLLNFRLSFQLILVLYAINTPTALTITVFASQATSVMEGTVNVSKVVKQMKYVSYLQLVCIEYEPLSSWGYCFG